MLTIDMKKMITISALGLLLTTLNSCKKENTDTSAADDCPYYLTGENCDKALRNVLSGKYYGDFYSNDVVSYPNDYTTVSVYGPELNQLSVLYCEATFDKDLKITIPEQIMPDGNGTSMVIGSGYLKEIL